MSDYTKNNIIFMYNIVKDLESLIQGLFFISIDYILGFHLYPQFRRHYFPSINLFVTTVAAVAVAVTAHFCTVSPINFKAAPPNV